MNDAAHEDLCPRCRAARLLGWHELDEAGREVVRRLPASADFTPDERAARRRWCPRCWHEESGRTPARA